MAMETARRQVRVQLAEERDQRPVPPAGSVARTWIALVALAALALVPAMGTLASRDTLPLDAAHFTEFGALKATAGLRPIWTSPSVSPQYLPLTYTTHWLEHRAAGGAATDSPVRLARAVNALLHVVNALLLWLLLRRLAVPAAWLGAAVFAVLAVQVETVAWISQRGVLLGSGFALLATLAFLRTLERPLPEAEDVDAGDPRGAGPWWIVVVVCQGSALLSGLTPLALPLVLAMLAWWRASLVRRRDVLLLAGLAAMSGVWTAVHWYRGMPEASLPADDAVAALLLPLAVPWVALRQTLVPVGLGFVETRIELSAATAWLWIAAIGTIALFVALVVLHRRGRVGRAAPAAAGAFVALVWPASGWVPWPFMTISDVAMHPGYLAAAAPAASLATGLSWLVTRRAGSSHGSLSPTLAGAATVLLAVAGASAVHLSRAYASHERLLERRITLAPDSPAALRAQARLDLDADPPRLIDAERRLRRAVEVSPEDVEVRLALADLYSRRAAPEAALNELATAARLAPDDPRISLRVAVVEIVRGRSERARALLEEVLRSPRLGRRERLEALNNLGLVHQQRGEWQQAEQAFLQAIDLDGRSAAARINLSNLLYARATTEGSLDAAMLERAVSQLERVVEIDGRNWVVWMNAGVMAAALGDLPRAERLLRVSVALNPQAGEALKNLGQVLLLRGESEREPAIRTRYLGDAVFTLRRACQRLPGDAHAAALLDRAVRHGGSTP
jgi:Flp pilus assembly protein TadD